MSYVTSNVVKLMFMAYFSLLSVTMMVISDRVNDAEHLLYIKSSFPKRYKSILIVFMKMIFFYLDPYILLIFNLSC